MSPIKPPDESRPPASEPLFSTKGLERIRLEIDGLDREIVGLLKRRAELAVEAGRLKQAAGLDIHDPGREAQVIAALQLENRGELPGPEDLGDIFRSIIRVCRNLQSQAGNKKGQDMLISKKMEAATAGASLVRKMFEEGAKLKAQFGADKVFDFSIGNPDVPPPSQFKETVIKIMTEDKPGIHGYMPNAGWPQVREQVAAQLNREQGAGLKNSFGPNHVLMTVGAAGALNITLKAIIDAGDEIITPRPYFMEYNFYADNYGAKIVPAEPGEGFKLNLKSIAEKIGPNTRAVLINSPHNPTGVIYKDEELAELGRLLTEAGLKNGRPIFLISDEPYRKLVYGGAKVPSVFPAYPYSIVGNSYSKDMSLPGERIGYAALNPDMPDSGPLFEAMAIANRILGFVSAPSLIQLAVGELQGVGVDIKRYEERRNAMIEGLQKIGYELTVPEGAFYLFPKTPLEDDAAFVDLLKAEKVLTVPGRGFGQPGYFRICYCVPMESIKNSMPGFARAFEKARG